MPERDEERDMGWALDQTRLVLADSREFHAQISEIFGKRHEQGLASDVEHEVHAQSCLLLDTMRGQVEEIEKAVTICDRHRLMDCLHLLRGTNEALADQYERLPLSIYPR